MKLTDKNTITSKTEPKMTNVTWLDVSGEQPVMRKYINGSWRPVGGGGAGGSLPTPTAEDEGKIIKVVKTSEKLYNIVPTQQVLDKQDNVLVNTNLKYFKAGNVVKCNFISSKGDTFREYGNIEMGVSSYYVEFSFGEVWIESIDDVESLLYAGFPGTLTIDYVEGSYGYDTAHIPFDTVITGIPSSLYPNIVYNFRGVGGKLNLPQLVADGSYCNWLIIFNVQGITTFTSTTHLIWQNGQEIELEAGHHYEISINYDGNNYYATYLDFYE